MYDLAIESLSFRKFLVEMETTQEEKDRIRHIIRQLIVGNDEWLATQDIQVGDKGPQWMLNYKTIGGRNEYNMLVRGMVVRKPAPGWNGDELALIDSFPFTRFYNRGETDAAPVDFANSEMLEKMDGTMVGVFFPDGNPSNPQWHTRRMLSSHAPDRNIILQGFDKRSHYRFMDLIGTFVQKLTFDKIDTKMTYVFEFIHDASKVITKYEPKQYGLYLLGGRNVRTHKEPIENKLDEIAKRIRAKRPRRWKTSGDEAEIQKIMDDMGQTGNNFEGFVFRDNKGRRVKLKREDYVRLHHLLEKLSHKHLIPAVLKGESDEITAHFPEAKKLIDIFQKSFESFLTYFIERLRFWRSKGMAKVDLAQTLRGRSAKRWDKAAGGPVERIAPAEPNGWVAGKILSCISLTDDEARERVKAELIALATGETASGESTNFNPTRMMEIIGLKDEEDRSAEDSEGL